MPLPGDNKYLSLAILSSSGLNTQCPDRESGTSLGISNRRDLIQGICYKDIGRAGGAKRERSGYPENNTCRKPWSPLGLEEQQGKWDNPEPLEPPEQEPALLLLLLEAQYATERIRLASSSAAFQYLSMPPLGGNSAEACW